MLDIFRRIDIELRCRRPSGKPIYENIGQRIDDDYTPEEIKKRTVEQEKEIEKKLQEIFDLQTTNLPQNKNPIDKN